MSNHQCLYPHIPMPGSYSKTVAVYYMTPLKLYLTSQYMFTVQADQQVCTALQNPTFSLFLSRSLSSCIRCIHPFLTLSLSVSLLLFLSVAFPLSVWFPKKWHVWWCGFLVTSLTCFYYLYSLCHCFALFDFLSVFSMLRCSHCSCTCLFFCFFCLFFLVWNASLQLSASLCVFTTRHGCITRVKLRKESGSSPTVLLPPHMKLRPRSFKRWPQTITQKPLHWHQDHIMVSVHRVSKSWPQTIS